MTKTYRHRVVIEVFTENEEITEGSIKRAFDSVTVRLNPAWYRLNGMIPSSVKVKRYSRVVAAEFGRIENNE